MTALEFIALDEATPQLRAPGAGDTYIANRAVNFIDTITGSYLTASQLLGTDGSKGIISLTTATYPSLTELSYVKGVTSAIQTQLDGKQPLDAQLTSLASLAYASNALKVIRVNAGENAFELASITGLSDGDKGDITVSSSGTVWTIDNGVVTLAKMADIATDRLIGRDTTGTGVPEALTVGGGVEFTGSGGIQTSAFTGDVTKSAGGTAQTIANNAVTYAKMQDVSAPSRVLGRKTAGSGDTEECTLSEVLDFVGSAAQGDILYRGAVSWTRLGAGTNGHFLQTQGAGANPQWAASSASPGGSSGDIQYNNAGAFGGSILKQGTNLIEQYNSTNAQSHYLYNTRTDASNYERLEIKWSSNVATLELTKAGSGSNRSMVVRALSSMMIDSTLSSILFQIGGVNKWQIDTGSVFGPFADNAVDLASSGTRIRNGFFSGYVRTGSTTVGALPSAATAGAGARHFVTDALTPVFGNTVSAGGSAKVPVVSDGSNWLVG